jgi:hypothetical protein
VSPERSPVAGAQWSQAWSAALDDLELEVERAEAMLRADALPAAGLPGETTWRPPALPQIPPDLVERARGIHARQLDVAARMTRRLGDLGRQSVLTDRIETGRVRPRPQLVDRAC